MLANRITISGGDSATHTENTAPQSRKWSFPDGVDRVITLPGWYWNTFDSLADAGEADHIPEVPYNHALETDPLEGQSFEEHLRYLIGLMIRVTHAEYLKKNHLPANANPHHPTPVSLLIQGALSSGFNQASEASKPSIFRGVPVTFIGISPDGSFVDDEEMWHDGHRWVTQSLLDYEEQVGPEELARIEFEGKWAAAQELLERNPTFYDE